MVCAAATLIMPLAKVNAQSLDLELSRLSPDEEVEFNRRRLAVEVQDELYISMVRGTGWGGTTRRVRYFEGFNEIREYHLLSRAGYDNEAEESERFHAVNRRLTIAGWTFFGVQLAFMVPLVFAVAQPRPDWDDPDYYDKVAKQERRVYTWAGASIGAGIIAAGFALSVLGRGNSRFTATHAVQAAGTYNRQLLEELRQE